MMMYRMCDKKYKFTRAIISVLGSSCLLVLLSSCGTTTKKVESSVIAATDKQVGNVPERFYQSSAASESESAAITIPWLTAFNDAGLTALVAEAQLHNKNLAAAGANVRRSQALAKQAGAALLPMVDLTAGNQHSGSPGSVIANTSGQSIALQMSWEVDLWGRLSAGKRGALASLRAVEADYRYAQYSLAAATATAYITAIEAKLQIAVAKDSVEILTETLRIVKVRLDNGMGYGQDLALAKSDLASARDSLITVEASYRDAVRALELLLGRYPSAETELPALLPALAVAPPVGLPSELLERRPDVLAAERRVAAAFNMTEQAKAARLPTVGLTGSFGGSSEALSSLLDPANLVWRTGASLLAPVFDGGKRKQQVNITSAEQEQALASYGLAAQAAFAEVESALDQGVVLARRVVDLEEVARESAEAFRISQLRYKEGEGELLDTLTIQRRLNAARSAVTSVERLQLKQRLDLYLALGGDWSLN